MEVELADAALEVDEFEIQIADEEHFDVQNSENCSDTKMPGSAFDIAQCDGGLRKEGFEPHTNDSNFYEDRATNNGPGNKLDTVHNVTADPAKDLLRASLTDVVLTQSLAFAGKSIGFEDGNQNSIETSVFVESFHNFKPVEEADKEALQKEEFFNVCTDSDIKPPAPDSSPSKAAAVFPPSPQLLSHPEPSLPQEKSQDFEDFDDAIDLPLLTSTLKADAKEDSDDEFGFDLPASKVPSAKTVTFLTKDESRPGMGVPQLGDGKEMEKVGMNEFLRENEAPTPAVQDPGTLTNATAQPVVSDDMAQSAPQQTLDVKLDEDTETKQDRSDIITSSAADWDNVETVEAGFVTPGAGDGTELMSSVPPLLHFADIWQYFRSMDHTAIKDKIQVTVEKHGFSALVSRLFGPPRLHKDLHDERELVFCIAATALDNREHQHLQSLQTVYRVLTGSRFNCQRYGSHWEEIGFQGRDPATDLRGAGMLALVQLVSFLQNESTVQLARDIYKLSLHPTQNFPFCVMCINISRISLQALREGLLNRECNRQKSVMPVMNLFYAGALLHLYRLWKQGKTISDSGFVIRDVETRAKKHSKELFKDLEAYIASQKAKIGGGRADGDKMDGGVDFLSVVKSDTKTAAELY